MKIIPYKTFMLEEVLTLIKETIIKINKKDYTDEQVYSWSAIDSEKFKANIHEFAFVAVNEVNEIIGFINMDHSGYVDHLFTHSNYQGQGIASLLVDKVEERSQIHSFRTYSSITAKSFFMSKGFTVVEENIAILNNEKFLNYYMKKTTF
ncbi:GNAT family N-acetyltransferase [Vagococcus fluvialis]|uniref:GNAT family N-acetyltransferase n=1 Tax=Vagococcus fluvialis TaxID=2738 RepID=UPI00242DAB64|nr:GNAT family N-acetyltransferase [Vagococcus fluvialis]